MFICGSVLGLGLAMKKPLAGKGIVVTRPAHQAGHLAGLISAAGGNAIRFPTIEIVAVEDQRSLTALIARLDEFDIAIFISPNAANQAMKLIKAQRELPPHLKLATIGRGGVRELEHYGVVDVIAPTRFDSEALLDMPEMRDVAGRRIVIFRGEGGRAIPRGYPDSARRRDRICRMLSTRPAASRRCAAV